MSYKIELTDNFKTEAKKLIKKYASLRIDSFVKIIGETVFLLSIYNKGDKDTISDKEIKELLKGYL